MSPNRSRKMKANYDAHTDILTVILKDDVTVTESDEDKQGRPCS
jgi:hypothetical protein